MSTLLKDKIHEACKKSFPEDRVKIDVLQRGRLVVTVVSESFAVLPLADRKARIRACLLGQLTEEENALVVNVIADTPDEHAALNETVRGPSLSGDD